MPSLALEAGMGLAAKERFSKRCPQLSSAIALFDGLGSSVEAIREEQDKTDLDPSRNERDRTDSFTCSRTCRALGELLARRQLKMAN